MLKPFLLAASLAALVVATPAKAQDTIKIGEINSYKAQPAFLEPYKKGWELAVEEVNAAGGVLGKKIQVISRDDNGSPGDAVRVAEELVSREGVALIAGTFLSNTGLAVTDFAKQKKVFFLAAEPLTDKITWQNGNRYTFRLRPNTYMQAAMLVPEAAKLNKKKWVVVYPNYEYGQSAAATFKAMLKKLQPDVEFLPDQATPLGRIEAGAVVQAIADAKPDAIFNVLFGADLSKFVREGNTRGLFKDRPVVSLLTGEPEYIEPLQRGSAGRLDRHRLSVLRHPDRRAQEVLPRLLQEVQRVPEARLGGRLLDHHLDRRGDQEGQVDRHREADRRVQRPDVHVAARQGHLPRDRPPVDDGRLPRQDQARRAEGRDDRLRLSRRRQVPAERRRGEEARDRSTDDRLRASSSRSSPVWPRPRRCSWSRAACR